MARRHLSSLAVSVTVTSADSPYNIPAGVTEVLIEQLQAFASFEGWLE